MFKGKTFKESLLLSTILIVVIPFAIIGYITNQSINTSLNGNLQKSNKRIVNLVSSQIELSLKQPVYILKNVAKVIKEDVVKPQAYNEYFSVILTNYLYFENIQIVDSLGIVKYASNSRSDYIGMDLSSQPFFESIKKDTFLTWSSTFMSILTNKPTVAVIVELDNKHIIGYLNLEYLNSILSKVLLENEGFIALLDQTGTYIAHTKPEYVEQRSTDKNYYKLRNSTQRNENTLTLRYDNEDMLIGSRHITDVNWTLVVAQSKKEVFAPEKDIRNIFIGGVLLSLLLATIIFIRYLKNLMRPMNLLVEKSKLIASGNYNAKIELDSYSELNELASHFNKMVDSVNQREKSLLDVQYSLNEAQKLGKISNFIWYVKTNKVIASEEYYKIFGVEYEEEGSYGNLSHLIHPDDLSRIEIELSEALKKQSDYYIEYRIIQQSGKIVYVYAMGKPQFENDELTKYVGVMQDVTERAELLNELRLKEATIEQSLTGFTVSDLEGKYIYANKAYANIVGYDSPSEILGKSPKDFAVDKDEFDKTVDDAMKEGSFFKEIPHLRKDGSIVMTLISANVFFDELGKPKYIIATTIDISKQKKSENELKSLQQVIENSLSGFEILDLAGNFLYVNKAYVEMLGFSSPNDMIGKNVINFVNDTEKLEIITNELKLNGFYKGETSFKKTNGEILYAFVVIDKYFDPINGKEFFASNIIDITDIKEADLEVKTQREEQQMIYDAIPAMIFYKDLNNNLIWVNDYYATKTGTTKEALANQNTNNLYPSIDSEGYYYYDKLIIENGQPVRNIIERILGSDNNYVWVSTDKIPIKDKQGNVQGILGISFDITQLKEAEEQIKKLNEELEKRVEERTSQLEASNKELEAFSYSVSHDLRAPLRAISGFSSMLIHDYINLFDDEGKELIYDIRDNVEKMGNLIDDLLQFSRLGRKELVISKIKMNNLVDVTINEVKTLYPNQTINWEVSLLPDGCGDQALIKHVLFNLISNAVKYSSKKEVSIIKIYGTLNKGFSEFHIEDNGCGFDMKYYNKIFKVFQRLHSEKDYEGTGVGLAIVHRIISKHNGVVLAESKLNIGSKFSFILPNLC